MRRPCITPREVARRILSAKRKQLVGSEIRELERVAGGLPPKRRKIKHTDEATGNVIITIDIPFNRLETEFSAIL